MGDLMVHRLFGALVALGTIVPGGVSAADKSRYSLFNPTPDRLMRAMTTDRPDTTETPFTIDAGHVQIESTAFGFSRSHADAAGGVLDTYETATTNVRIGLTNDVEINFVWQPYGWTRYRQTGLVAESASGVGGLDIRAKVNLWGNDDFERRGSALALLPYITLPTDAHNGISPEHAGGGLLVPLEFALPHDFGIGFNGRVAWMRDEASGSYRAEYLGTAALSYEWTSVFATYCEIVIDHAPANATTAVALGAGLTYAVTENLQLDAGVNFGVTTDADRFNPFVGVATRF